MPQRLFPAILFPADNDGLHGVFVPGINVNGSGDSADAALADAAAILQEVIDDLASGGDDIPLPTPVSEVDSAGGTLVMLPGVLPGRSTRINITMDEDLVRRIDAATSNRSAFLADAARAQLAASGSRFG